MSPSPQTATTPLSARQPVTYGSPELAELLERVSVGASERDRDRIAPHEAFRWIKDSGLGRLRIPPAEGGAGASMRQFFEVLIALSEADSNVAHALRVHYAFVEQQLQSEDVDSRHRWLSIVNDNKIVGNAISELNTKQVSLGALPETRLTTDPSGDGHRLNGVKFYSTGTLYSDWVQVWTSTEAGTGAMATIPVDREGVTVEDDWDGFGQRLTGTGTTRFDDVWVADDEIVDYGAPDGAKPPSYEFAFLQLYLQAVTAGILRSVRNDAVALVRRRKRGFDHSTTESPADDPQVLQVVGEISADAFAAEAIVLAAADKIAAAADSVTDGLPDRQAADDARLAAAQAKVAVDRFAPATATALFDAGGASATQTPLNLDRHWRNVRTLSTHNPTSLKASAIGDLLINGSGLPQNGFF